MIFLFAAILVSMTLVFSLKIAHVKGWNSTNVIQVNYIVGTITSLVMCLINGSLKAFREIPNIDFSTIITEKSVSGTMFFALALGLVTGILYVTNIRLTDANVKNNGAGISTLFSRSGFLVSTTLSVLVFSEAITVYTGIGALLTVMSLAIAGGVGGGTKLVRLALLVSSLFCIGVIDFDNKIFQTFALQEYKTNFTLVTFMIACTMHTITHYIEKRGKSRNKIRYQEVLAGIAMGIPNVFGNILQILALEKIPASIMFPSMAAGSLLMTIILSTLIFKEHFGKRQLLAVALTTISLVLVNVTIPA